jgi:hypothetical protein
VGADESGFVLHSSTAGSARLVCTVTKPVASGMMRMTGTKNIIVLVIDPPRCTFAK